MSVDELQIYLRSILLKLSTLNDKLGLIDPTQVTWKLWIELPDEQIDRATIESILVGQNATDSTTYFVPSTHQGAELKMTEAARLFPLKSMDLCRGRGPRFEVLVSENQSLKTLQDSLLAGFSLTGVSATNMSF